MNSTRIKVAVLAIGAGLALAGCSNTGQIATEGRIIDLPDGRTVVCVVNSSTMKSGPGGVSCDWENAR